MQGSFSASYDEITWVLTSYITAAAIMTAPVGLAGDALRAQAAVPGVHRRLHPCLHAVRGGAVAAADRDVPAAAGHVQRGAGAAVADHPAGHLPRPSGAASAMAIWGIGVMIGPIMGPTLGGYLTETLNWRYVFYINLPFGLLATVGLAAFLPNARGQRRLRFDWVGFAVLSLGIGALQTDAGPRPGAGLVQRPRDHCRGGAGRPRHLPVPRARGVRQAAADPADPVQGPQLRRRTGDDVLDRHHPGVVAGADDAVAAGAEQLSGGDRGPGDGAARHRQPGHDRAGRAARRAGRPALPGRHRAADDLRLRSG